MFTYVVLCLISQVSRSDFSFVFDTTVPYHITQGEYYYYGHLDQSGEFVLDAHIPPQKINREGVTSVKGRFLYKIQGESNLAYELRSGMLIPGKIEKMKFIPEAGGVIIKFEDYDISKDKRYIYNLPGKFVYKPRQNK